MSNSFTMLGGHTIFFLTSVEKASMPQSIKTLKKGFGTGASTESWTPLVPHFGWQTSFSLPFLFSPPPLQCSAVVMDSPVWGECLPLLDLNICPGPEAGRGWQAIPSWHKGSTWQFLSAKQPLLAPGVYMFKGNVKCCFFVPGSSSTVIPWLAPFDFHKAFEQ